MDFHAVTTSAPSHFNQAHSKWGLDLTEECVKSAREQIKTDGSGISDAALDQIFNILYANQSSERLKRMNTVTKHSPKINAAVSGIPEKQARAIARTKVDALCHFFVKGRGNGVRTVGEFGLKTLHQSLPSWSQSSFETFQGWLLGERTNLCNQEGGPLDILACSTALFIGIGNLHSHCHGPSELSVTETEQLCQAFVAVVANKRGILKALKERESSSPKVTRHRRSSARWLKKNAKFLLDTFHSHVVLKQCILTGEPTDHNCFNTSIHSVGDIRQAYPLYRLLPCTFVESCEKQIAGWCPLVHDRQWRSKLLDTVLAKRQYCPDGGQCSNESCYKSHTLYEQRSFVMECDFGDKCYDRATATCRYRHDGDETGNQVDDAIVEHAERIDELWK